MRSSKGMTLIEVVIVVVIIAFVAALGLPRMFGNKAQIQGTVRTLAVLVREVKNAAKLNRSTYRLALEIPDTEALEKKPSRYWVEKTPGSVIVSIDEEQEELQAIIDSEKNKDEPRDPSRFQLDQRITKQAVELPRGMFFTKVEVASREEPVTQGIAYIYFLPEGYVEQSVIHIKAADKLRWTLALAPVTGKVDIIGKEVSLSELQR